MLGIPPELIKTKKVFVSRYHYVKAVSKLDGLTYYAVLTGTHDIGVRLLKEHKARALTSKQVKQLKNAFPKEHFERITVVHVNTTRKKKVPVVFHYVALFGDLRAMVLWDKRKKQWNVTLMKDFNNPVHCDTLEEARSTVDKLITHQVRELEIYCEPSSSFNKWFSDCIFSGEKNSLEKFLERAR
jgi:hypothetical protein